MTEETKPRMDSWTTKEDEVLIKIILRAIREGDTQLIAFERGAYRLGRTASACSFRWNNNLRKTCTADFTNARNEGRLRAGRIKSYSPERAVEMKDEYAEYYEQKGRVTVQQIVQGVGPDAPTVINERGGSQSESLYRMDLLDPKALLATSRVLKEGADKYGANNWKLIDVDDHLNHLLIHVYAYLAGDKSDEHLSHAVCRALFALGVELEAGE